MPLFNLKSRRLTDGDLDFVIKIAAPEVKNKHRLKQIIREDEDFRNAFIDNEKIFKTVLDDNEILLKISPFLFFEILLRKTANDFKGISYTLERTSSMRIPVFDTKDLVELLAKGALIDYLADMLSSFTKIESFTVSFRIKKGFWKKIRFNDIDIHSLMSFCDVVEDDIKLVYFKRIADVCLFMLGIYPDYTEYAHRYPSSGEVRPQIHGNIGLSPEDYLQKGQKFYKLAAEHPFAQELDISDIFWDLHANFQMVKKPLNFIAEHYLNYKRHRFFG